MSVLAALVEWVVRTLEAGGAPALFALIVVESFGVPLPSEVILPFAGFMVADGVLSFPVAVATALAGGLGGSLAAYAVGRRWRHRLVGLGVGRWRVEARHLELVDRLFARHGDGTVAFGRMVPVVRGYISYPAGAARMPLLRFSLYTTFGSVPFTVALIYAGWVLRKNWDLVFANWGYLNLVAAGAVAALLAWAVVRHRRRSVEVDKA